MISRGFAPAVSAAAIAIYALSFAEPAASESANDAGGLEEVVVTAQRREESAQNVGIALSVLSGQSLAGKAITHVVDLQHAIRSLQGDPQYRICGVGFLDYTTNNASPAGVSVADVAFALPIQTQGQLFDIDRTE